MAAQKKKIHRANQWCNVSPLFYAKIMQYLDRRRSSQPVQCVYTKASAIGCIFGFLHHFATRVAKMARDLRILIFHTPDGRHICF